MSNAAADPTETPGYDRPAVEAWIAEHVTGLTPPFEWVRLEAATPASPLP
ncbi:MAG: hypothetical protein R2710_21925 [Acidimicrobiales bacterium]